MSPRTPVLATLAALYETSAAGRHGGGKLDFQPEYEALLSAAGCAEGEARELAERDLQAAHEAGLIVLVPIHRRDPRHFGKVRFAPVNEAAFFAALGLQSPTQRRAAWAALFEETAAWPVPQRFTAAWASFCQSRSQAAQTWRGMRPFQLSRLEHGRETLALLSRLLAWEGEHLVRWASSVLCGDSKELEGRQTTLETLLAEATGGAVCNYAALGILPVPPGVTFHGPLRLRIGAEWRDFRDLHGPATLSGADVARVTAAECAATRCITVENRTPFQSLAALGSGELLIHTSYPNEATLALLRQLANLPLEFWHFGDSDPDGFQILADLRARSGFPVRPLRMNYRPRPGSAILTARERAILETLLPAAQEERGEIVALLHAGEKGDYEQESLGPPPERRWPFYP